MRQSASGLRPTHAGPTGKEHFGMQMELPSMLDPLERQRFAAFSCSRFRDSLLWLLDMDFADFTNSPPVISWNYRLDN
jgi:hypothetical protein